MIKKIILFTFIVIFTSGCGLTVARPKLEMTYAQTAFLAAKDAGAQTLAPNLYRKAEYYYLKAKSSYRRKFFNQAKKYAEMSKAFAEQAEFKAYKKKTLDSL